MTELNIEHITREAAKRPDRVYWTTPRLTNVKLVLQADTCNKVADVVSCEGEINGHSVQVTVPFRSVPLNLIQPSIVHMAQKDHVYARGIGILDNLEVRSE